MYLLKKISSFTFILCFATMLHAQVDLVKLQAEINSAKADLEEARQARDVAVAKRWQERAKQNEEREVLEAQYESRKEKLESALSERSRLFEELRVNRESLEFAQNEAEKARAAFYMLSPGQERLNELKALNRGGIHFAVPEVSLSGAKEAPLQAVSVLFDLVKKEIEYTRKIELEDSLLRLGGVGALKIEDGNTAMFLPQAGEKGRVFLWQENLPPEIKESIQISMSKNKSEEKYLLVPIDPLLSATIGTEMANRHRQTLSEKFIQTFKEGGILMYPISAMLIIALIFIFERLTVLILNRRSYLKKIREIVFNPKIKTRLEAEKEIEAFFSKEVPSLERRLLAISVLGTTAPLLGLLGTVMGMISMFEVITMHGTADPKLLAGGISLALVTTEAGLCVAIPVHLLHTWISGRVDKAISRMDFAAISLINERFSSG